MFYEVKPSKKYNLRTFKIIFLLLPRLNDIAAGWHHSSCVLVGCRTFSSPSILRAIGIAEVIETECHSFALPSPRTFITIKSTSLSSIKLCQPHPVPSQPQGNADATPHWRRTDLWNPSPSIGEPYTKQMSRLRSRSLAYAIATSIKSKRSGVRHPFPWFLGMKSAGL